MRLCFLGFLAMISCLIPVSASVAQDAPVIGYTATEKTGFAFYDMIRQPPPFDRWIETREDYLTAKPKVRLAMMDAERLRLRQGFAAYIPNHDLITIRVPVRLETVVQPDLSKLIKISFPDFDQDLYFPFQLGDVWVALVPAGLEAQSSYTLTTGEYSILSSMMNVEQMKGDDNVTIEVTLLPIRVDTREPIEIKGIPLWLMLANVQTLSILDKENRIVMGLSPLQKANK